MSNGKVVCITGAGHGIGRAAANAIARDGATVVVGDLDAASAQGTASEIEAAGGRATAIGCDVSNEADVAAMIELASTLGGLDRLVNNAGIFPRHDLATMNAADLDRVMAVNVRGPLLCTLAAVPLLKASNGHIVYVGTGSAHPESARHPQGRYFPFYGASKAALERLVASFAVELEPLGIGTSIFRPPATRTEGSLATGLSDEDFAGMTDADDVAAGLAWLVAQPSMTPSGQTFEFTDFGSSWGPSASA